MTSHVKVMLVEDDAVLGPLVVRHLSDSGFAVDWRTDGKAAYEAALAFPPDLMVLDLMLPGEDGLSLCRRLRKAHDFAIIIVTARGQESDRILGLELGADDYLPKPFSLWELEARMKAVLRRYHRDTTTQSAVRTIGPLCIDLERRTASVGGRTVELTRSEFDILARLTAELGRVFSRDQLLECVQGGAGDSFDRAIDTHVSNLRRKIGDDPRSPRLLKTVWGVGYRFECPN
jgi:DNA-binding response OmpR family regulator